MLLRAANQQIQDDSQNANHNDRRHQHIGLQVISCIHDQITQTGLRSCHLADNKEDPGRTHSDMQRIRDLRECRREYDAEESLHLSQSKVIRDLQVHGIDASHGCYRRQQHWEKCRNKDDDDRRNIADSDP